MYIEPGVVFSLSHMFYVSKGPNDIHMVYNASSCELNSVLWAPHFGLPVVQHTLRSLLPGYYQCNMDVGKMFLNFPLHNDIRSRVGVDITHVKGKDGEQGSWEQGCRKTWGRWSRNFMGLTDSLYRSLQLPMKEKFII